MTLSTLGAPRSSEPRSQPTYSYSEHKRHVIEEAWIVCVDLYVQTLHSSPQDRMDRVEDEMLFCLLGGFAVPYELCASAAAIVSELRPFSEDWAEDLLIAELFATLNSPIFEPQRRDGSLRKYRFPRRKSELILRARQWVLQHATIANVLEALQDARARRTVLCSCPGVGLKTASWILRNTDATSEVAILDVHIIRSMQDMGRIGQVRMPKDYERTELAFLDWCRDLGAPPAAFDLFVWEWQRGLLRAT